MSARAGGGGASALGPFGSATSALGVSELGAAEEAAVAWLASAAAGAGASLYACAQCSASFRAARGLREAAGRVSRVAVVGRGEGGGRLSVANRGQAPRPLPPGLRAAGRLPPASTMRHAILLVAAALAAAPGEKARHAAHAPQCRPPPPPPPPPPPSHQQTPGATIARPASTRRQGSQTRSWRGRPRRRSSFATAPSCAPTQAWRFGSRCARGSVFQAEASPNRRRKKGIGTDAAPTSLPSGPQLGRLQLRHGLS